MHITHHLRKMPSEIQGLLKEEAYIGIAVKEIPKELLFRIGFSDKLENGECVLPSPIFGKYSKFNSFGRDLVLRDQPKELFSYDVLWDHTEYHGRDNPIDVSSLITIQRKRYPRKHVEEPCEFLTLIYKEDDLHILSRPISLQRESVDSIIHLINLIVEIFGYCNIFDASLNAVFDKISIRKKQWKILPLGKKPWLEIEKTLSKSIQSHVPKARCNVLLERLRVLNCHNPDECVIGIGGFNGYFVLLYKEKDLAVFESPWSGNATYIFSIKNWEIASRKTKKEILDESQALLRVIHKGKSWFHNINDVLGTK